MRIGILASHRVPCGIAQYSERLAAGFRGLGPPLEPVILAGRADEHRSVPEEWDGEVHDVAKIGLWRDDGVYELDVQRILDLKLDVVHVQYQSMLFSQEQLKQLCWNSADGVMAITYHDNCQRPDFPHQLFDLAFTHRWNVGPGCPEVISFGIEDRPPVIRTFGLGRTRSDLLSAMCAKQGWVFESGASHEPIQGGGQHWRTNEQLIEWLRGADAVVLWYDEVSMAGASQAARTALATRRPVYTNDTTWFSDLPSRIGNYYQKVSSWDELQEHLGRQFQHDFITENSWTRVAQKLVDHYRQAQK